MTENTKYFKILLELLEGHIKINNKELYIDIADTILSNTDYNLEIIHKNSFLFYSFRNLLQGFINVEDFLATGDIDGKYNLAKEIINPNIIDYINYINYKLNLDVGNKTIFILDKKYFSTLNYKSEKTKIYFI